MLLYVPELIIFPLVTRKRIRMVC